MANVLPIYAMNPTLEEKNQQIHIEENTDMTNSPSESSAQASRDSSMSSSTGNRSSSSSDDSGENSDSGLSAPSDAKVLPFYPETELNRYMQRFPEYLVDAVSRDIDALFLYPDRRTTSDGSKPHSEEDLVISVPNGETVKKAETDQRACASLSVAVPSAASIPPLPEDDLVFPVSSGETAKKGETD